QFDIPTTDPGYDQANDRYTITLGSHLAPLDSNITINGLGANRLTVKRDPAASAFGIFTVNFGKTVTISGLTISGGAGVQGAGIHNDHATLTMSNCTVSGNDSASRGGGLFNDGAGFGGVGTRVTVTNSTFSGNSASFGGGIFSTGENSGGATLIVTNSTFSGN